MSGTFSQNEKVNFAVKSLLQLTTKYGSLPNSDEGVALPRVFPISIRKDDIIKNGVGDLEGRVVDVSAPWGIVQLYKIIDPIVNKVSNINVGNILTDNNKSGQITFSNSTAASVSMRHLVNQSDWDQYSFYSHWYADASDQSAYPDDGPSIATYKGIRLAYSKTPSNTTPTDDDIVPHLSLYLHVKLSLLEGGGMSTGERDTIAFYRQDQLTRNMLGPEVGFDIKLLAESTTPYSTSSEGQSQSGIINKNDVINNSTFGAITLFSNYPNSKYGTGAKTPRLSFCRYIGESVDFSNIGGGGGASVTVGVSGEDAPTDGSKGDLFFDIDDDTLKINKDGTADGWVGVGGGGSIITTTSKQQILETIVGMCDGQTINGESGNYTLENVTQPQIINSASDFTDVTGSMIAYTIPNGTNKILYKFSFSVTPGEGNPTLSRYKLMINKGGTGNWVQIGDVISLGNYQTNYGEIMTYKQVIKVDSDSENLRGRKLTSWPPGTKIKLQAIKYSYGNYNFDVILHKNRYSSIDLGADTDAADLFKPILSIQSIGTKTTRSGGGASVTVGAENEDAPTDGSKGELFFDIDDDTLKINKDGTADGWVGVGGGGGVTNGTGLTESQVLESISTSLNGSSISPNNSYALTLSTAAQQNIVHNSTNNYSTWTEQILISSYKVPKNTKQLKINSRFFITRGSQAIEADDQIIQWGIFINDEVLINSLTYEHLDLIEKYINIETSITIGEGDNLLENKINTWNEGKKISIRARQLYSTPQAKFNYSNSDSKVIYPLLELKAIGFGIVGIGDNKKNQALESIVTSFNGSTIRTNKSGSLTFDKISAVTTNTTSYTEITLIDSYIPPENTKSVLINYSVLLSKGWTSDRLNEEGGILEWVLVIDSQELSLSKNSIHIDLVDKYATISTIINIGDTTDYNNNKIATWTTGKKISVKCKSLFIGRNIKLHYSNDIGRIILPTFELIASGVVSSSNLNSILKIGNAGEDPPSDGAKGELFFDIDDNKLYINKDSTSNGWVTVSSSNTASINSKIEVSEIIDGEKKIYENKWIKSEELTFAGESKYEMFGLQVDINNNFALITQFKNDSNGDPGVIKGLHVYEKGINNWNYLYYLYHSEPIESNTFGQYPIEIKGSNIAVALNGMVFIYQLIDGNWGKAVDNQDYRVENYKLYTSDRDTNNLIPYRVTIGEKYLAISTGQELNKVYIYNFDETTGLWGIEVTGQDYRIENYIINSPQSDLRVKFGFTTSINNNYIAIGTQEQIQEKVPVPPAISYYSHGSIYIYKRNDSDGTWIQIQKLVSSYDTTYHFQQLILKDNFLIAEDSNFSENGISNGQVLVFYKNSDDTWGEAIPGNSLRYQSSILRDGTGNGNRFGNKISYNDDTLAVSSQLQTVNNIGAVYIFNRDPITGIFGLKVDGDDSYTIPNQEIINPEILPNAYSSFGFSLSISNKELLIGSYGYGDTDTPNKGKTYLYKKYSVINSDNFNGKDATIENAVIDHLVSNKLTNSNNKTVFENILSDNISQTVKDPLDNGEGQFGKDMDFSEKYMIIGSPPRENTYDGKCHIYNINNEGLLSFSKTITDPTVNSSHTTFGNAVAINDKYAVVGDYRPSSGVSGKVYIYKENNGNWSLNKEISSSDNLINAYFGIDIAINSKYIAVGASRIEGIRGAVFLYELDSAGNWGKSVDDQDYRVENYKLLPSNPINYNYFGNSIAMSEKYIVVGSYGNQTAYVYEMHSDGKWGIPVSGQTYRYENSRLKGSTITNDNTGEFGRSVATYGEYVVVGAQSKRHTTNPSDNSQGAAFIYEKINDGWIELHEIKALTSYKENFSNSIYLNDRYIIVGAMGNPFASNHDTLSPPHGGVAYIFEKNLNTGKWGNSVNGETYMTESFKISTPSFDTKEPFSNLSNTDIRNSEYKFGWKVLINNKLIYISAPAPFNQLQYTKTEYKGIIYLFEFKNYPKLSSAVTSIGTDGILHIKSYNYPMDNTDYHWPESVILQTTVDGRQSDFLSGSLKDNGSYHNTWMDYRNILALQPHCGRVGIGVIAAKSRLHVNNDVGMANDQQAQERGIRLSYLDKWNHYINIAYNDANSLEICANGDIGWAERGGSHGDGYGSIQLKVADKTRLKIKTHPADGDAVEITPDGPDALAKTTIKSESLTIDGVGSKIILKNRSIYDNLISIDTGNESKGCTIECTNFGTNVKKSLLLQPYGGWVGIGANDTFTYIKGRLGIGTHSDFSAPTSAYPADSKPPLNIVGPQDDSLGSSQKNTYCVLKSKTRAGFYMFHRGNYNERHMFFGLHQDSTNEVLIKSDKGTMQFWAESTIKSNKTIQVSSDNRLKHNEENIENALDTINKLNPMKYIKTNNLYSENHHFDLDISNNPLDQSGNHLSESWFREVGLIAQDILKIPELKFLVKKNEDYIDDNDNLIKNPYTVDYNSIFCYSIQAIKELDQKNKDLINKVSSLETQNSNLLTRLEALEKKINELS